MTASTHGTFRTMTRPVVMAGIVTVGATALTLPFTSAAQADDGHQAIGTAAERTDAPAAFAPQEGTDRLIATPGDSGDDGDTDHDGGAEDTPAAPADEDHTTDTDATEADTAEQAERAEEGEVDGKADGFDADTGRGEEYHDDGSLVVIPQDEQPKPEPASEEEIDGWIKEALEVMDDNGIPGSYEGIHRNLIRESAGDPLTINLWDTNAEQDIPSKGLLQVIDPTFEAYHVEGTSENIYDPVANIVAACNYAADRYGSMDNVDSAY
ncbi:transglycosylase SLT domain-containing protein [Streptomyces sp. DSM 44915]|uniref:Transglycosylase SLT domain-containing protein n=2 Tax=Streptomyces chisholmiae TaxID=3075540 RepID=A0ABU2JVW8_9ACTN|nr:transglycosylase SLT domain-containing protein [Streptomyces sp. DSM 44915]MDT0269145.1 transglycosylase SLT domain-containing protein [Streptomyces sp. DSM 44915]